MTPNGHQGRRMSMYAPGQKQTGVVAMNKLEWGFKDISSKPVQKGAKRCGGLTEIFYGEATRPHVHVEVEPNYIVFVK